MSRTAPSIEFDRLCKQYGGKAAIRDLTLRAGGGEVYCFLGPNGAGKTTSIHVLMGLKHPTGGDVRISGVSVASPEIHTARQRIGYLPDQPVLYDFLTGREFVQFVSEMYGTPWCGGEGLDSQLKRFGMAADADRLVKTYSLGMKKKIALIAALAHDPDILVLDEPTGALDAFSARAVKDLILEAREAGKLVFITTHVLEVAEQLADRIGIINLGQLVAEGTMAELRAEFAAGRAATLEELFLRIAAPTPTDRVPARRA